MMATADSPGMATEQTVWGALVGLFKTVFKIVGVVFCASSVTMISWWALSTTGITVPNNAALNAISLSIGVIIGWWALSTQEAERARYRNQGGES